MKMLLADGMLVNIPNRNKERMNAITTTMLHATCEIEKKIVLPPWMFNKPEECHKYDMV